jgi:enamine deaminase RidA (YjgF/YER057c/UK114 family)
MTPSQIRFARITERTPMTNEKATAAEPILPVRLGRGDINFARGVKAGSWVFSTGNMAQCFGRGIADDVVSAALPHSGLPREEKEAIRIFNQIEEVLVAGGTGLPNVVRVDQYFTDVSAVDPYHVIRRARFGDLIPPSTSMIMDGLLLPEAHMDVQVLAVIPREGLTVEHLNPSALAGHPTSGYSPSVRAGDFVFLAGMIPSPVGGDPARSGLAEEAQIPEHYQWRGRAISLETDYVLRKRILPALERAGSSLKNVVKAQVYLTHLEDFASFNAVWQRYFLKSPPVTTLVPSPQQSIGARWARVEINVIALVDSAASRHEQIGADVFTGYEANVPAIRVGDLLLLSGLMAIDRNGLVTAAQVDRRQPHFQSTAEAQARHILQNAAKLCEAGGTSLSNVVRAQHFFTDIRDFHTVYRVWQEFLPGAPIPFSAVQVPGPMPVPGATLLMDLWFYAD